MGVKLKKGKGSLAQRSKRLAAEDVRNTLTRLLNTDEAVTKGSATHSASAASSGFLSAARSTTSAKVKKSKGVEVVSEGSTEVIHKEENLEERKKTSDLVGLRLMNRALMSQSYQQLLPHQERGDYEYKLRKIATTGVVRLFNSLKISQKVGENELKEAEHTVTIDKAQEKKLVASRDAFLAALRTSQGSGF
eukprot:GILI01027508.1.p1 GENE.GILI01027508.1~~GILI01027508.1.p1  ORF type:complete len:192 (-),score=43.44 GILI01027508.1:70-645(-)